MSVISVEEYRALLKELTRIRQMRDNVPQGTDRAMWTHKDIDILIAIIWAQSGALMHMFNLQQQIEAWIEETKRQEEVIANLQRRVDEECK